MATIGTFKKTGNDYTGEIFTLSLQAKGVRMQGGVTYSRIVPDGLEVIEDAKGFPTPEYKLKRAILAAQGVTIVEV